MNFFICSALCIVNLPSYVILFLANVPNPDDPIDLSRSAVLADTDSIQVVQESSALDTSIDLNHNLEENSNNVV